MDKPSLVKIVPKTRKKLLQQALLKDSPKNSSILARNFFHQSSKSSVINIENFGTSSQSMSVKSSPLRQREVNVKRIEIFSEQVKRSFEWDFAGLEEILLKLWKCGRMRTELDESLKAEIFSFAYTVETFQPPEKILSFFSELKRVINKQSVLPESLSPYLEELISNTKLSFPLIRNSSSLFEAETLLFIPIVRFSKKKISVIPKQFLRKITSPSIFLLKGLKILLLCLYEILETCIKKPSKNSKIWETFLDLSSNPGQFTQTIRKLPECIRKNLIFSENLLKIQSSIKKLQNIPESLELFQLLSEIAQMVKVIQDYHRNKVTRLKRIEKNSDSACNSSRAKTPATSRVLPLSRRTHSRSASKESLTGRKTSKKMVFLQESRFNKRIGEDLLQVLVGQMKEDPEYLKQVRREDFSKYLMFKSEFIDIHKDTWIQEGVRILLENQKSDGFGDTYRIFDTKNIALQTLVSDQSFLSSLFLKAKKQAFKV